MCGGSLAMELNDKVATANATNDKPVDKQINKIIAIAKYKFHWKRKAIFNYICDSVHDAGIRVTMEDARHYKYSSLLGSLSIEEKSLVIKRLEKIEKRNAGNSEDEKKPNLNIKPPRFYNQSEGVNPKKFSDAALKAKEAGRK